MKLLRRKRTLVVVLIGIFALAVLILVPQVIRAQKGAYILFLSRAKQVGVALNYHHQQHGEWPATLGRIDPEICPPREAFNYPAFADMPVEMRDLPKDYPTEQWLYFPPRSGDSNEVMLAAPLPFRKSTGKIVRIVVHVDTTASLMDELSFGKAIEKQIAEQAAQSNGDKPPR